MTTALPRLYMAALVTAAAALTACTTTEAPQPVTEVHVRAISSGGFCGSIEPAVVPVRGVPGVNPAQEQAFRIDLGQQPSGGYKLELVRGARLSDGRLTLPVRVRAPAPDSPQTAVLSQPCLVVAVTHDTPLRAVHVVSTDDAMPRIAWP